MEYNIFRTTEDKKFNMLHVHKDVGIINNLSYEDCILKAGFIMGHEPSIIEKYNSLNAEGKETFASLLPDWTQSYNILIETCHNLTQGE